MTNNGIQRIQHSNLFHDFLNEIGKGVYICFSGIDINILLCFILSKQKQIEEEFDIINTAKIQFFSSKIRCRQNSICDNISLTANKIENVIIFDLVEKKIHKEFSETTYTYILCCNQTKLLQTNKFNEFRTLVKEKQDQSLMSRVMSDLKLPKEINMCIFDFLYPYNLENMRLLPLI